MKRDSTEAPISAPILFGKKARWSERDSCWQWRVSPLLASAFRTPRGSWWITGSINSFRVSSRAHADIERALDDFEQHLTSLSKRLAKLVALSTRTRIKRD